MKSKGTACVLEDIRNDIEVRDYNDSHRAFASLKQADDAVALDTTAMSVDEVTAHMLNIINGKRV